MDIHTGSEDDVATVLKRLVAHRLTYVLHQFGIPRSRQTTGNGETRGKVAAAVTGTYGVNMNTRRSVARECGRNTETRNGIGYTGSTIDELLLVTRRTGLIILVRNTHQKTGFLLQGH